MKFKLFSIGIICLVIILAGCSVDDSDKGSKKLTVGYMSNFMADIGDATALGISKKAAPGRDARAASSQKNYLVKTTVDYSAGNVEWDESGLTNVTFKKRTTETVIIDGKPVEEGQTVTQDEIPAQVNRLYVYNNYTFIQFVPNETLTSDTRDQHYEYFYHQDGLGYYKYDKQDYYNDDYHQSFVIENKTGNIYSLENTVYIESLHNGLLRMKDSPFIWDCRINARDELEIFTLFQNETINVYDFYKDKYGNNYILNDRLNIRDGNTIFTNKLEYHVAINTGEVVFIDSSRNKKVSDIEWNGDLEYAYFVNAVNDSDYVQQRFFSQMDWNNIKDIKIMVENGANRTVMEDDYFEFSGYGCERYHNGFTLPYGIFFIKNKEMFIHSGGIIILDTDTGKIKQSFYFNQREMQNGQVWLLTLDTFLVEDTRNKKLYYYIIDYNALPPGSHTIYREGNPAIPEIFFLTNAVFGDSPDRKSIDDDLVLLLQGFDERMPYGEYNKWTVTTINSQDTYSVYLQEVNGKKTPVVKKEGEYVAGNQQVITLKPINR